MCNLTVDTNRKKQLGLILFPSHIKKLLGKDLTSTEIEERLLKYKTVNIAYNNCNVIVSVSAKSNSEKSEREKESDCVKKKKK